MKWSDVPLNPPTKTLRQFAAGCLVFFLAVGAHQYWRRGHHEAGIILALMGLVLGGAGLLRPLVLRHVFIGSMVLAFPIGWVVSQIMLAVMFYLVVTPIALLLRIRGRDTLSRKSPPGGSTFWLPKQTPEDVRSYFRQY